MTTFAFSVEIDQNDLHRILTAVNRVDNSVYIAAKQLPYKMALECADLLRRNISTGAIAVPGNYSRKYIEYKQLMVGHQRPWILFGDVLATITVFRHDDGFMAGIPAGRLDRGEKGWYGTGAPSHIAAYAYANEYGEGNTPERPVFRPTAAQYKGSRVQSHIDKTKIEIKRHWK